MNKTVKPGIIILTALLLAVIIFPGIGISVLDTELPVGRVSINKGADVTTSTGVTLEISASDSGSGVVLMKISNDPSFAGAKWENYSPVRSWTIIGEKGVRTVFVKFRDTAGNESAVYSDNIDLDFPASPAGTLLFRVLNRRPVLGSYFPYNAEVFAGVYGDKAVFADKVTGNADIFLYDFPSGETTRLTNNSIYQFSPRICGNQVAWLDYRRGVTDLYLYNLSSGSKRRVDRLFFNRQEMTDNIYLFDLDERYLVYSKREGENRNIYLYDITAGKNRRLTNGGYNVLPNISDDYVIYINRQGKESKILLTNIQNKKIKQIYSGFENLARPSIYGDNVVFSDNVNISTTGEGRIYHYSISKDSLEVIPDVKNASRPEIFDDRIIWSEGDEQILREYKLNTKQIRKLVSHSSQKPWFDVYANRLVWLDNYSGRWGIYSKDIDDLGPSLSVEKPGDNYRTSESSVELTGAAEPGSIVEVNGTSVVTDDAGNFSHRLILEMGTNTLTVTATDAMGNTTIVTRMVVYSDDRLYGLVIKPDPVKLDHGITIQYSLTEKGYITIAIYKENGDYVRTVANNVLRPAGFLTQSWDGKDINGKLVADGKYKFVVEAKNSNGKVIGRVEKIQLAAKVPRLSNVSVTPDPFNPLSGGPAGIKYTLSGDAMVTVTVYKGYTPVETLAEKEFTPAGNHTVFWNGMDDSGSPAGDAAYNFQIEAVSSTVYEFKSTYKSTFRLEKEIPKITGLTTNPDPVMLGRGSLSIRFDLNENAKVTLKIVNNAGNTVCTVLDNVYKNAGNNGALWYGTDSSGKNVPEGTYKLVISAVDSFGNSAQQLTKSFKAGYIPAISNVSVKPNPFKPGGKNQVVISFKIDNDALVTVEIMNGVFNVRTVVNGKKESAGAKLIYWNGKDNNGNLVGPGTYYYRIIAVSPTFATFKSVAGGSITVK